MKPLLELDPKDEARYSRSVTVFPPENACFFDENDALPDEASPTGTVIITFVDRWNGVVYFRDATPMEVVWRRVVETVRYPFWWLREKYGELTDWWFFTFKK